MIEIRSFTAPYAEGVVALILPIQQAEFGIPVTLLDQPDLKDITGFYQHGNGNFWLALDGGEVVGTVALLDIGEQQVALRKMFVASSHRGAEHGVARHLLDTAMAWCASRRVRDVYLGSTAQFLAAHRFYEKNGFGEVARADLPQSFPVMKVDSKFYRRAM